MGWFGMRERASLRQVKGSTPDHWHRATKLRNTVAVAAYQSALVATPWALYRVRRIYHAARNNPAKKGQADRAVELLALIEPTLARPILDLLAARLNSPIHEQHGIAYVYQDLGAHQE